MDEMEEILKEFDDIVNEIKESGYPVLVEGINDMRALERLGVKNKIILLKSRGTLQEIIERIHSHDVILLTDWDRSGRILFGKCMRILRNEQINAITELRKRIMKISLPYIYQIEELVAFRDMVAGRIHSS